jgi:hypothetical protein
MKKYGHELDTVQRKHTLLKKGSVGKNKRNAGVITGMVCMLLLGTVLAFPGAAADDSHSAPLSTFTLDGFVLDDSGSPISGPFMGPPTQIKIVELNESAIPMVDGYYQITDIPPGTYTVRAYFGSIDHSVVYREARVDSNLTINWTHGKTWVQGSVLDSSHAPLTPPFMGPPVTVKVVETNESVMPNVYGEYEIGDLDVGEYYTVRAYYGAIDHSTSYTIRYLVGGEPNIIDFIHGKNSVNGYVFDSDDTPLEGQNVSALPGVTTTTDSNGFYSLENLTVGENHTIEVEFTSKGNQTDSVTINVSVGPIPPINFTFAKVIPEAPSFITASTVVDPDYEVHWTTVDDAEGYVLYEEGMEVYNGSSNHSGFTGRGPGSYTYQVKAYNANGSSILSGELVMTVRGGSSGSELWTPGMSWSFEVSITATGNTTQDTITYTVLTKEDQSDLNGTVHSCYKVRKNYGSEPETVQYEWYDNNTLDLIASYANYGTYSSQVNYTWDYDGIPVPYTVGVEMALHYMSQVQVSVPGHPLIVRDTHNIFRVNGMEEVTVPAGTFDCYNITVTDIDDGIVSWNYFYNDTAKHWVRMVDRLPNSMADVVIYEMTDLDLPERPAFITETGVVEERTYDIQWNAYEGALSYTLFENMVEVYSGTSLNYTASGIEDGNYTYVLVANLSTGPSEESDPITITVAWEVPTPSFVTQSGSVTEGTFTISWNPVADADRYVLYEEGEEIYNGTGTSLTIDERSDGTYRYQVKAISEGQSSPLSSSTVITVEMEDTPSNDDYTLVIVVGIVLVVVVLVLVVYMRRT